MAVFKKIANQYKNDTFNGVRFTLVDATTLVAIDLTGASIRTQFRYRNETGAILKEITDLDGITVEDAVNGIFKFDAFIIDWAADLYYYDVEVTFTDATVKTYVKGTLKVIQDVTYG